MFGFKWYIKKEIWDIESGEVSVLCKYSEAQWNEEYGDNLCEIAEIIKKMASNKDSGEWDKKNHNAWWWNCCMNIADVLGEIATVYYKKSEEN